MSLNRIWDCMFSPRLFKVYENGLVPRLYEPSAFEKWGDQVIYSLSIIWKIGVYTSPILVAVLYERGYLNVEGLNTLSKFVASVGVILMVSYFCRGLGRCQNKTYLKFLDTLKIAEEDFNKDIRKHLSKYEFEFKNWPVDFAVVDVNKSALRSRLQIKSPVFYHNMYEFAITMPFRIIAYLAIHTFGIRLIYPGSLGFLQIILDHTMSQGRSRLIEMYKGERYKLKTIDSNEIDTMFIDKRSVGGSGNGNGTTLVVCSEGNAGFYEIGIMITPIEAGYSVLGWNHPGFAGSTGQPYPPQEQNAIDAVMQFAIEKLGFKLENILLFGWSIGGYSSSWAAMNYPDVKGIILDASFDDILPLAIAQMPTWWRAIVRLAIREQVNLNVAEQLVQYPGPVLLIRRTEDEVICLRENDILSNRGNNLLIKLLTYRYPIIFSDIQIDLLNEYLSLVSPQQEQFLEKYGVSASMCHSLLQSYISEYSKSYPMKIGEEFNINEKNQMVLYLARKYMKDYKSSHCINLPSEMFQNPWDVNIESDYVFT